MTFDAEILREEPATIVDGRTRYAFTFFNPYAPKWLTCTYNTDGYDVRELYVIVWDEPLVNWLRRHIGKECRFYVRLAISESETKADDGRIPLGVCWNVRYDGALLYDTSADKDEGEEMYYKMIERDWVPSFFDWYPRKLRIMCKGHEVPLPYYDRATWDSIQVMNEKNVNL